MSTAVSVYHYKANAFQRAKDEGKRKQKNGGVVTLWMYEMLLFPGPATMIPPCCLKKITSKVEHFMSVY